VLALSLTTLLLTTLLFTTRLAAQAPAPGLRLEEATFHQFEDGPPYLQAYRAGEQVFLDLRVAGYGKSEDENPELKLKWTFEAVDGAGRRFEPPYRSGLQTGLAAQDSDYRPRARYSVAVPVFALEGNYRIQVKVTDEVTQQSVEGSYLFRVRGKVLPKLPPLGAQVVFFRQEEEANPLSLPVYRAGAQVWLRFDIQGFTPAKDYSYAVNYGVAVLGPDRKSFLTQDPAATDQATPFYPQAFVPAAFVIQLPPTALAGDYRVTLTVRDLLAKTQGVTSVTFRVE